MHLTRGLASLCLVLACLLTWSVADEEKALPLDQIHLPAGFSITVYADEVPNARALTLGPKGTVFAGSRGAGKVHAVVDTNKDHKADKVHMIAEDLLMPTGVAFREGSLYVAAVNQVLRFDDIENRLENPPEPVILGKRFPSARHHGWKFIAFGPDGLLYVQVGAPCNICESRKEIFATITRMKPDGSEFEIYAHGVRNTVGFDWHPETKALWFTDNGRDWMGDDMPPDELNRATKKGQHFGYPYCHGTSIPDPDYGDGKPCSELEPPARELGPHVAAIGMRFYTGDQFPASYRNSILIAEHGSWNRSVPIGYRIMQVQVEKGEAVSYEVFAEGWLQDSKAWGRPADVLVMPDGAILVSDDKAGVIYRISYAAPPRSD